MLGSGVQGGRPRRQTLQVLSHLFREILIPEYKKYYKKLCFFLICYVGPGGITIINIQEYTYFENRR